MHGDRLLTVDYEALIADPAPMMASVSWLSLGITT